MSDENRPSYYDEIDRIVDIAAAAENARLEQGGAGVGDKIEGGIEYDGNSYGTPVRAIPIPPEVMESIYAVEHVKDIADQEIDIPFPPTFDQLQGPIELRNEVARRVDVIKAEVMSFDEKPRLIIGYLLTVIDAYERGQL